MATRSSSSASRGARKLRSVFLLSEDGGRNWRATTPEPPAGVCFEVGYNVELIDGLFVAVGVSTAGECAAASQELRRRSRVDQRGRPSWDRLDGSGAAWGGVGPAVRPRTRYRSTTSSIVLGYSRSDGEVDGAVWTTAD